VILTLWLALLALGFGVCLLGYFTDDEPYLTVGLAILFLLGIAIVTGQLQYQNGDAKNVTFSYNGTTLQSQAEVTAYTYTSWNDLTSHIVGYLLSALSGVGIALSLRNTKKTGADDEK
jgi:hypothetical protein